VLFRQGVDFAQSDVAPASAGDPSDEKPPAEAGATSISIMAPSIFFHGGRPARPEMPTLGMT